MGCCGRGASNKSTSSNKGDQARARAKNYPGSEGTTKVRYVGTRVGNFTRWGPVTGSPYRVRPGYEFAVDNRDLDDMLKRNDYGKKEYVVIEKPKPPKAKQAPAKAPAKKEEPVEAQAQTGEDITIKESREKDKGLNPVVVPDELMTIPSLVKALKEKQYTIEELSNMLSIELAGKNRKGIVSRLEEAMQAHAPD